MSVETVRRHLRPFVHAVVTQDARDPEPVVGEMRVSSRPLSEAVFRRPAPCGHRLLVRAEGDGAGQVLVVNGGASQRCALFGGNLAKLAADNGWAGIIINGCVRDTAELAAEKVGIKALGVHPRKSQKRGLGIYDVPVKFAGVRIYPGDWIYADEDGIILSPAKLDL